MITTTALLAAKSRATSKWAKPARGRIVIGDVVIHCDWESDDRGVTFRGIVLGGVQSIEDPVDVSISWRIGAKVHLFAKGAAYVDVTVLATKGEPVRISGTIRFIGDPELGNWLRG